MLLLDVNFTLFGPYDRDQDRIELYDRAKMLGRTAWASDSQFYLLTPHTFEDAHWGLAYGLLSTDFLKLQEVSGRFAVVGRFPPAVDELFKAAARLGVIEQLSVRKRPARLPAR